VARPADPRREQGRELYTQGLSRDEVAERLGVDPSTVTRWVRDIARPRGRRKREDIADEDIAAARERGESYEDIGERLGVAPMTAWRRQAAAEGKPRPDRPTGH